MVIALSHTPMRGGLTGLYYFRHTNYQCFLPLLCSLFYQTGMPAPLSNFWQQIFHTTGRIPANKLSITSCLDPCSILLPEIFSWASSDSGSLCPYTAGAGRWLTARSMNNITGPTNARKLHDLLIWQILQCTHQYDWLSCDFISVIFWGMNWTFLLGMHVNFLNLRVN